MTLCTLAVWFGHFADLVSKAFNYPREDPWMVMGVKLQVQLSLQRIWLLSAVL